MNKSKKSKVIKKEQVGEDKVDDMIKSDLPVLSEDKDSNTEPAD